MKKYDGRFKTSYHGSEISPDSGTNGRSNPFMENRTKGRRWQEKARKTDGGREGQIR